MTTAASSSRPQPAPAAFGQSGQQFGISGGGAGLYSGDDDYSTIYDQRAVGTTATVTTEVAAQQNLNGYAKAGLLVRNDITASGQAPEGVILFESPSGGIQLEWNDNSGTYIDNVTPANGTIPASHGTIVRAPAARSLRSARRLITASPCARPARRRGLIGFVLHCACLGGPQAWRKNGELLETMG